MSDKRFGTYRVNFKDGTQVIFGNNYKPWWQHAVEYIYRYTGDREKISEQGWRYRFVEDEVESVEFSNQQFFDDGGLKWCQFNEYQSVINDACRDQEIVPIKAEDIIFRVSPSDKATLTKKLKEY